MTKEKPKPQHPALSRVSPGFALRRFALKPQTVKLQTEKKTKWSPIYVQKPCPDVNAYENMYARRRIQP